MVTHTIVFSFPDDMSEADRDQFFSEGSAVVLASGFAEAYLHGRNIPIVDEAAAALPPIFAASAIAYVRCADIDSAKKLFAHAPLGEFVKQWQAKFPYKAVSVNTQD
jgi:hypothetical protein